PLPRTFAEFIHSQHFARVTWMLPREPSLKDGQIPLATRGLGTVHFISTFTTGNGTLHPFWCRRIFRLPNFSLKLLTANYVTPVGFWHASTLPQDSDVWKPHECRVSDSPTAGDKPSFGRWRNLADSPMSCALIRTGFRSTNPVILFG